MLVVVLALIGSMVYTIIIVTTVTIILVLVLLRELGDLARVSPFRSLSSVLTSKSHISVTTLVPALITGRGSVFVGY